MKQPQQMQAHASPDENGNGAQWGCLRCTFLNDPGRSECGICGALRDGSDLADNQAWHVVPKRPAKPRPNNPLPQQRRTGTAGVFGSRRAVSSTEEGQHDGAAGNAANRSALSKKNQLNSIPGLVYPPSRGKLVPPPPERTSLPNPQPRSVQAANGPTGADSGSARPLPPATPPPTTTSASRPESRPLPALDVGGVSSSGPVEETGIPEAQARKSKGQETKAVSPQRDRPFETWDTARANPASFLPPPPTAPPPPSRYSDESAPLPR
eukprot:Polyplicarium_translucidae@DN62_c0_g1_i1.p1